jgi:signal transduction histidine kinase
VAVLLAAGLSSTLLRRLGRLRGAALRITEAGPDSTPMPHDERRDEVGDLARALARMQEELRRQETARRAFVSTASHELRTPLTMLQGTMELLEEDLSAIRPDLPDAQEQVATARRELRRLSALAGELLDLSRLDAAVPLRSEPVELGEVARAVAAEFELRARERDVVVDVVPPEGPCRGRGDPDAVARVVRILLDNALRYGPSGEAVRVVAGGDDGLRPRAGRPAAGARAHLRALPPRQRGGLGGRLRARPGHRPRARDAHGRRPAARRRRAARRLLRAQPARRSLPRGAGRRAGPGADGAGRRYAVLR